MKKHIIISGILLTWACGLSYGQIKDETLILKRNPEKEIQKIAKPKKTVQIDTTYPPEEKAAEKIFYDITDIQAVSDFKTSQPVREDISPNFKTDGFRNYIRGSFGNYMKIKADGDFNINLHPETLVGVNFSHISTEGLKNTFPWNSAMQSTQANLYLKHNFSEAKLNLNAGYDLQKHHYYGDPAITPANNADLMNKLGSFLFRADYQVMEDKILEDVQLDAHLSNDRFSGKESFIRLQSDLGYRMSITEAQNIKFKLGLGALVQNSSFSDIEKLTSQTNFINIKPQVEYRNGVLSVSAGAVMNLGGSETQITGLSSIKAKNFYVSPLAELRYAITDDVQIFGGVTGGLSLNTYRELYQNNPYILPGFPVMPTETQYEVFFGISGNYDKVLKYELRAAHAKKKNMPFYFLPNPLSDFVDGKKPYGHGNAFGVLYDEGAHSTLDLALSYFPMSQLEITGNVRYQYFNLQFLKETLYQPSFTADVKATYRALQNKLSISIGGSFVSERNASNLYPRMLNGQVLSMPASPTLAAFMDMNATISYNIHKNISIFAAGNNLLNSNQMYFDGYRSLGIQGSGGILVKF